MVRYENECVGCPTEMGCRFDGCPNRRVPHFYCDRCGAEVSADDLMDTEEGELCVKHAAMLLSEEDLEQIVRERFTPVVEAD